MTQPHLSRLHSRRELFRSANGLGSLALTYLLTQDGWTGRLLGAATSPNPLAPKKPHHTPKAKAVIWLFMEGGPSHVDLWDYKPTLEKLAGQPMPASFGRPLTAMGTGSNGLMPTKHSFQRYGQAGIPISDWLPNIAQHADDLAVINSCWGNGLTHVVAMSQMNTGNLLAGRPTMGAWLTYGLGTANENLPTFVALADDREPVGGPKNWTSGFLPAVYQGTQFRSGDTPILHLTPPETIGEKQQRDKLDFLAELQERFDSDKTEDTELDARLRSYELAYKMQSAAQEAVDLGKESEATRKLYGLDEEATAQIGSNCLMARRLVERGVRFVQLYCGSGSAWDAHTDLENNHGRMCKASDKPIAGLLTDLKSRGLLDSTLVVWGGEFGRTPFSEKGNGRDHNPWGFSMWMAGGGVKAGQVIGKTDDIGLRAVERACHIHDLHASILHLLGLNHVQLTFQRSGRMERPTITGGELIKELLA